MADSVRLCKLLVAEGVQVVVATPHQLGRYDGAYSRADILAQLQALSAQLQAEEVPLLVVPGADIRVDERLLSLLDADVLFTLADAHEYLLLELPHDIFIDLRPLIAALVRRGITPIVTHPERHGTLQRHPEKAQSWRSLGAIFQITAGSLLGAFGPPAEEAAWRYIESGVATVVASDAHDTHARPPLLKAAYRAIGQRLGLAWADLVCLENPRGLLPPRVLAAAEALATEVAP